MIGIHVQLRPITSIISLRRASFKKVVYSPVTSLLRRYCPLKCQRRFSSDKFINCSGLNSAVGEQKSNSNLEITSQHIFQTQIDKKNDFPDDRTGFYHTMASLSVDFFLELSSRNNTELLKYISNLLVSEKFICTNGESDNGMNKIVRLLSALKDSELADLIKKPTVDDIAIVRQFQNIASVRLMNLLKANYHNTDCVINIFNNASKIVDYKRLSRNIQAKVVDEYCNILREVSIDSTSSQTLNRIINLIYAAMQLQMRWSDLPNNAKDYLESFLVRCMRSSVDRELSDVETLDLIVSLSKFGRLRFPVNMLRASITKEYIYQVLQIDSTKQHGQYFCNLLAFIRTLQPMEKHLSDVVYPHVVRLLELHINNVGKSYTENSAAIEREIWGAIALFKSFALPVHLINDITVLIGQQLVDISRNVFESISPEIDFAMDSIIDLFVLIAKSIKSQLNYRNAVFASGSNNYFKPIYGFQALSETLPHFNAILSDFIFKSFKEMKIDT